MSASSSITPPGPIFDQRFSSVGNFSQQGYDRIRTKEGIEQMYLELRDSKTLFSLDLSSTHLGGEAINAIGEALIHNSTLTRLYLNSTNLNNEEIQNLMGKLRLNTSLRRLEMKGISMNDESVHSIEKTLEEHKTLTEINIQNSCNFDGSQPHKRVIDLTLKCNKSVILYNENFKDKNLADIRKKVLAGDFMDIFQPPLRPLSRVERLNETFHVLLSVYLDKQTLMDILKDFDQNQDQQSMMEYLHEYLVDHFVAIALNDFLCQSFYKKESLEEDAFRFLDKCNKKILCAIKEAGYELPNSEAIIELPPPDSSICPIL